jgi:hypothetical protein
VLYQAALKISQRDIAALRIEQFRTFELLARAIEERRGFKRAFVVWFPECSSAVTLGMS